MTDPSLIQQLLPSLINIFEVFLLAMVPIIAGWFGKKLNDKKISNKLETNLSKIIETVLINAKNDVLNPKFPDIKSIKLKDQVIPDLKFQAKQLNEKTIKRLKLSDDQLEEKIKHVLSIHPELEKVLHLIEDNIIEI